MARLPRLALPASTHHVVQRGAVGPGAAPVFADETDRLAYRHALGLSLEESRLQGTQAALKLHAFALLAHEVHLLLSTGDDASALSRFVQSVGRRYVSAYNRRHAHRGGLWAGRFQASVVEPGRWRMAALRFVDGLGLEPGSSSAASRTGGEADPLLVDPPELWSLGNTPFDREARYRAVLAEGLPPAEQAAVTAAARGGWVLGSPGFVATCEQAGGRRARPRTAGRPGRQALQQQQQRLDVSPK